MKTNRTLLIAAALATAVVVIALVVAFWPSDDESADLEGTSWRLDAIVVDGEELSLIDGTSASISFADGEVQGVGGCNSFFGGYETDDDEITLGPLASTEMFCDEPTGTSDQETEILLRLDQTSTYRIEDGRLILADASDDLLVFSPV
ncbi:MAG: META domain-containing protein [Actinomycetota bacterium]